MVISGRKTKTQHILGFETSIFYNHIYNMISLAVIDVTSTPPLYTYINIDTYKTFGLNMQGEFKYKTLSLVGGFTYSARYNLLNNTLPSVEPYSYAPELRLNVGYLVPKIATQLNIFGKYNGALPSYFLNQNNEVEQGIIDPYSLLDASASKSFYKNKIALTAGAKNILNVTNINNATGGGAVHGGGTMMPVSWGTSYFVQMTLNL
jgi:outer membrane receptor for ferrienterochelin and colicins